MPSTNNVSFLPLFQCLHFLICFLTQLHWQTFPEQCWLIELAGVLYLFLIIIGIHIFFYCESGFFVEHVWLGLLKYFCFPIQQSLSFNCCVDHLSWVWILMAALKCTFTYNCFLVVSSGFVTLFPFPTFLFWSFILLARFL